MSQVWRWNQGNLDLPLVLAKKSWQRHPENSDCGQCLGWLYLKKGGFFSFFIIWVMVDLVLAGLKKPQWQPVDPKQVYGS